MHAEPDVMLSSQFAYRSEALECSNHCCVLVGRSPIGMGAGWQHVTADPQHPQCLRLGADKGHLGAECLDVVLDDGDDLGDGRPSVHAVQCGHSGATDVVSLHPSSLGLLVSEGRLRDNLAAEANSLIGHGVPLSSLRI